jgi:hypothetical protein
MPLTMMLRIITFVLSLNLPSIVSAQGAANVSGRVTDQTGGALPGVTIDLTSDGVDQTAATDADGRFTFASVAPGPAELTFRLINFSVVRRAITAGADASVNVVMSLSLSADILVTAPTTFRNIADADNPAADLVGIATSSSQGAITATQLRSRPIMRAGEVLETVPGMVVSQHSGEGKANQYYLRGFNLDHGTDFSTTVAGIPVNTPTGAHAHGYADASFLIPELVAGVQFKKGTYFADEGDFAAAGAANINYLNRLDGPTVNFTAGQHGYGRVFAAASPQLASATLLAAVELNHNDGPWDRPDDYRKLNSVVRYSRGDARNGFSLTGMGYWADWDSTDQVASRALASGLITRFGNLDPTDGGQANRQSVSADFQRSSGASSLRGNVYAMNNALSLYSNFTFFLDDQENGDQFEQSERRTTTGGRVSYRRLGHVAGRHVESAVGAQTRHDWLSPIGLYSTVGRARISTTREDVVGLAMSGAYAQSEIEWSRHLRITLGLRADVYQFDVESDQPLNSGSGSDAMVSPKFSAVFGPWSGTEFYVNAGLGFHSNDARGAVISVNPSTGDAVAPVTPLVRGRGAEVGVRTVRLKGLQSTLTAWHLGLDSELLFVGDAGTTEAGRPSRRMGLEWTNYWRVRPWLTADADLSLARAEFTDDDLAGDAVPGSLDRVISGGVTVEPTRRAFGSIRLRHFGPRPLTEDRSVVSQSTTLWNGEVGWRLASRARVVMEIFNLFDADAADIDYFYTSRLIGEPAAGVADMHTHPALPRTARLTLQVGF